MDHQGLFDRVTLDLKENKEEDAKRDCDLQKLGITVLRYKNEDINSRFNAVCEDILRHLGLSVLDLKK